MRDGNLWDISGVHLAKQTAKLSQGNFLICETVMHSERALSWTVNV